MKSVCNILFSRMPATIGSLLALIALFVYSFIGPVFWPIWFVCFCCSIIIDLLF